VVLPGSKFCNVLAIDSLEGSLEWMILNLDDPPSAKDSPLALSLS
jgi:hypothetical protein